MNQETILLLDQVGDDAADRLHALFPSCACIDARREDVRDRHFAEATIIYGLPPIKRLAEAKRLRWVQLLSAGVPRSLCAPAQAQGVTVTNLAGLYGPSIAEHTLALMSLLGRNLHIALRNQHARKWDNSIAKTMTDLAGKTVAVIGMGNIGQAIARLAKAYGMRVVGCRRSDRPTPFADRIYPLAELCALLAEGDYVVVATPLTTASTSLLCAKEFAAMKPGAFFVNVSRGKVADEQALLGALRSGRLAGAALDVFHVEPLPDDHPLWDMDNVVISPHYSGDTVNHSSLPMERFTRNLRAWLEGRPLAGLVDLGRGY
jgi:phosphoglycerate dehydrogenase-like enzyme